MLPEGHVHPRPERLREHRTRGDPEIVRGRSHGHRDGRSLSDARSSERKTTSSIAACVVAAVTRTACSLDGGAARSGAPCDGHEHRPAPAALRQADRHAKPAPPSCRSRRLARHAGQASGAPGPGSGPGPVARWRLPGPIGPPPAPGGPDRHASGPGPALTPGCRRRGSARAQRDRHRNRSPPTTSSLHEVTGRSLGPARSRGTGRPLDHPASARGVLRAIRSARSEMPGWVRVSGGLSGGIGLGGLERIGRGGLLRPGRHAVGDRGRWRRWWWLAVAVAVAAAR